MNTKEEIKKILATHEAKVLREVIKNELADCAWRVLNGERLDRDVNIYEQYALALEDFAGSIMKKVASYQTNLALIEPKPVIKHPSMFCRLPKPGGKLKAGETLAACLGRKTLILEEGLPKPSLELDALPEYAQQAGYGNANAIEPKPEKLVPESRFDEIYAQGVGNMDKPDESQKIATQQGCAGWQDAIVDEPPPDEGLLLTDNEIIKASGKEGAVFPIAHVGELRDQLKAQLAKAEPLIRAKVEAEWKEKLMAEVHRQSGKRAKLREYYIQQLADERAKVFQDFERLEVRAITDENGDVWHSIKNSDWDSLKEVKE